MYVTHAVTVCKVKINWLEMFVYPEIKDSLPFPSGEF